jgi:hypothetical protein
VRRLANEAGRLRTFQRRLVGPAEDAGFEEGAVDEGGPRTGRAGLTLPLGPSNSRRPANGIRRRSAAKASRSRVSRFSLASRFVRAAGHSARGFSIMLVDIPDLSFDLSSGRFLLLRSLFETAWTVPEWGIVCGVLHGEFPDCDCRKSAHRGGAAGNQHCGCYAHWAHGIFLPCYLRLVDRNAGNPASACLRRGRALRPSLCSSLPCALRERSRARCGGRGSRFHHRRTSARCL